MDKLLPKSDIFLAPEEYFVNFEIWLKTSMPELNMQILAKEAKHDMLWDQIQHLVDTFPALEQLTYTQKVRAIQYFGFAISSMERHAQDRGFPAGHHLASINGAESLLLALGEQTGYPPRDTLYTFATMNRKNMITFSGDAQEELFIDVLNQSGDLVKLAGDLIRPVTRGQMQIDDDQSVGLLMRAERALEGARKQFLRYMEVVDVETGRFALSIPFFRDVLRQFTCDWVLGGEAWTGASAADAVEFKKLDYLIGTVDDHFRQYVFDRMKYLPPHQKVEMVDDMQHPSLLDVVMKSLGLFRQELVALSEAELIERLRGLSERCLEFVKQYVKLAGMNGRLSATHWSLMANYLMKPTEAGMGTGLKERDRGTAHITFEEIVAIRDMRRLNPYVKKLSGGLGSLK